LGKIIGRGSRKAPSFRKVQGLAPERRELLERQYGLGGEKGGRHKRNHRRSLNRGSSGGRYLKSG